MINWRVYGLDGKGKLWFFSNLEGEPDEVPAWGVQAISERNEAVGRRFMIYGDYYVNDGVQWLGFDEMGLFDHLTNIAQIVRFEQMVEDGRLHTTYEFYDGEQWVASDSYFEVVLYMVNTLNLVKVGRMVARDAFLAVMEVVKSDKDLPRKSGLVPLETKLPKLPGEVSP